MTRTCLAVALALATLASTPVAFAAPRWRDPPETPQQQRQPGPGAALSADDAARRAQSQYGGRVLAVRPEGPGYRVKLLKDGEVRSVYVGN